MNAVTTDIDALRAKRDRLTRTGNRLGWLAVLLTFGALIGGMGQLVVGFIGPDPALAWWIIGGGVIFGRIVGAISSRYDRRAELLSRDLIREEVAAGVTSESTVDPGSQRAVDADGALDAPAFLKGPGELALTASPAHVRTVLQQAREAIARRSRRGVLQGKLAMLVGVGLMAAGVTSLFLADFDSSVVPVFAGTLIPGVLIGLFGLFAAAAGATTEFPRADFAEDALDALGFDTNAPMWAHLRMFEGDGKGPWLRLSGTLASGAGLAYERTTMTHTEYESVRVAKHVHTQVLTHGESYFVDTLTLQLQGRTTPFSQPELGALAQRMQLPGSARVTGIEATGGTLTFTIAGAHDLDPGSYLSDVSRDVARGYAEALGTALAA